MFCRLRLVRGGVFDLSVHPSGRAAISCGKDKALKLWDLTKGRCIHKRKLQDGGETRFRVTHRRRVT